ncbi:MAG: DUF5131 family protein, partial [Propionicimonas sp.]
ATVCVYCHERRDALTGRTIGDRQTVPSDIGWIITGGETGPDRRPFDNDWARSLRDQARDAGIPFFYKQDTALLPGATGPDDLHIQRWPAVAGDRTGTTVHVTTTKLKELHHAH